MREAIALLSCLLFVSFEHSTGVPQRPEALQDVHQLSEVELALLEGYSGALERSAVRTASLTNLLRQIRIIPPVAFVDGYWVTAVDFSQLFEIPSVRAEVDSVISRSAKLDEVTQLLNAPARLKQITALVFSAGSLREGLALPYVGDFARIEQWNAERPGVFVVPVKDAEWAVNERIPPYPRLTPEAELECYFFCGDPATWDSDADDVLNSGDADDDGDGVPDERDAYPYWPGAAACSCGGVRYVGFTETFSLGITAAVLASYARLRAVGRTSHTVAVGGAPGTSFDVRLVVSTSVPDRLEPMRSCPDSTDPAVRYVSTDPRACAALRFRCRPGEVPFSDDCGCGCRGER